jgi:hypothetical protein
MVTGRAGKLGFIHEEGDTAMHAANPFLLAKAAIFALASIKEATTAFDRGQTNAHDALGEVAEAVATYQAACEPRGEAA